MLRTLRGKFSLVYLSLALLSAVVGLVGFGNLYRLEQSVNDLMTANYKSIDAVSHMMEAIERQDSAALIFITIDRDRGIDLFTQNNVDFLSWFDIERGNVTEQSEQNVVDQLNRDYALYSRTIYELQSRLPSGEAAAQRYYTDTALPLFEKIKSECRQLISTNEQAMFASKQRTTDSIRQSMILLLVFSFAVMFAGFLIAHYFVLRFLSPIRRLSQSISRVREGDLNQQVQVTSNDEAGSLVREFNDMTRRLLEYEKSNVGVLLAEKNKSVAIVHSISDPLFVLDNGWRILLINNACADFFDLREGEALGRHFLEVIHNGELFESVEALAASPGESPGKIVRISKGKEYYFNLLVTRVDDPENRNSGIIVALQNVTGLKEMERVRSTFLSAISHEFKTPLTSIIMAVSMLQEGKIGPLTADQAEAVAAIQEDGNRLLGLVTDLLELMRIESGKDVYHMQPCNVQDLVDASARALAEAARARDVTLACELERSCPAVRADFEKIRWVLNNLIGNAVKHSRPGGTVAIGAEQEGGFVSISIRDTGDGIPEERIGHIFDRFIQFEGEDPDVKGTGVGLSTSKEIIEGHGGQIAVRSAVGQGSTFTFTLPIGEEARRP